MSEMPPKSPACWWLPGGKRQKHQSPCERGFGFLSEHLLSGDQGLFDVLNLFAHLFDEDLELDGGLGGLGVDGLGA